MPHKLPARLSALGSPSVDYLSWRQHWVSLVDADCVTLRGILWHFLSYSEHKFTARASMVLQSSSHLENRRTSLQQLACSWPSSPFINYLCVFQCTWVIMNAFLGASYWAHWLNNFVGFYVVLSSRLCIISTSVTCLTEKPFVPGSIALVI